MVEFLGDGKSLSGELKSQGKTSKFGSFLKSAGKAAAVGLAAAGAAVVAFGASSVRSASDAQQSIGATETVFGKFSKAVIKDSNEAAKGFGLSANEYRENANLSRRCSRTRASRSTSLAARPRP